RSGYTQDANNNLRGTFNFLGRWTNAPFADFLLGLPNAATRQVGSYRNYLRNSSYSAFFQDDWRVARTLTLNFGVRCETYHPPADKYGRWTNFVPELGKQVVSSTQTLPNFESVVQNAGLGGAVTTADT